MAGKWSLGMWLGSGAWDCGWEVEPGTVAGKWSLGMGLGSGAWDCGWEVEPGNGAWEWSLGLWLGSGAWEWGLGVEPGTVAGKWSLEMGLGSGAWEPDYHFPTLWFMFVLHVKRQLINVSLGIIFMATVILAHGMLLTWRHFSITTGSRLN